MSDVRWIKISTSIFDDEKIRYIESSRRNSNEIIVTWFRLLVLAGKACDGGKLTIAEGVPYKIEDFCRLFRRKKNSFQQVLSVFLELKMIEEIDLEADKIYKITNWGKYQNLDSYEKKLEKDRIRKQKAKEQKQLVLLENKPNSENEDTENSAELARNGSGIGAENSTEIPPENKRKKRGKSVENLRKSDGKIRGIYSYSYSYSYSSEKYNRSSTESNKCYSKASEVLYKYYSDNLYNLYLTYDLLKESVSNSLDNTSDSNNNQDINNSSTTEDTENETITVTVTEDNKKVIGLINRWLVYKIETFKTRGIYKNLKGLVGKFLEYIRLYDFETAAYAVEDAITSTWQGVLWEKIDKYDMELKKITQRKAEKEKAEQEKQKAENEKLVANEQEQEELARLRKELGRPDHWRPIWDDFEFDEDQIDDEVEWDAFIAYRYGWNGAEPGYKKYITEPI